MPIHVVTAKTGIVRQCATRSPGIAIFTDAASPESVPQEVRAAAEYFFARDVSPLLAGELPPQVDGALVWLSGERLLRGAPADLRATFHARGVRTNFIPIHRPGLPEADLIGIEPRIQLRAAGTEIWNPRIRLFTSGAPSHRKQTALRHAAGPWATLATALSVEQDAEGAERLKELWQTPGLEPRFKALVLRNLIVRLTRQGNHALAGELATAGMEAFSGYAEICFLGAVLCLHRQEPWKAVGLLEKAMGSEERGYLGSGGENSYRAAWLLGSICARAGDQGKALNYFLPGIGLSPAFRPSVDAVLGLQMSRQVAAQIHQELCLLVRRQPQYLETVFQFYLRHRVFGPPRRLLQTLPLSEESRGILEDRLSAAQAYLRTPPPRPGERLGVILSGPFLLHSGHARINRKLAAGLAGSAELEIALEPAGFGDCPPNRFGEAQALAEGLARAPSRLDLTIRHHWPPDFRAPEAGKLACILPWEHRAVPRKWVEEIQRHVDELWAPSEFVAQAFRQGGVDAARVRMIPNGVDTAVFSPAGESWRPPGCRSFAFLFVGGAIRRKGVDLLLEAYADAFDPDDDVTLIIKDIGSRSFYAHNTLIQKIARFARRRENAHVVLLTEEMPDARLAGLYRGSDVLAHPFRAEGFGMPLLEAMACGKPVITSDCGPANEFCAPDTAYLIPGKEVEVAEPPPPLGEMSREWTWFEPDVQALARALRQAYENPAESAERGRRAALRARTNYGWERIVGIYRERICSLCGLKAPREEAITAPAEG
ncbi:MAG TPA: glycosyltransferase family 4 protein [Candidatus Binatia bacterium]|nr:glycosyltransferase family 4 protein [Candidatus Binatia bacterium]